MSSNNRRSDFVEWLKLVALLLPIAGLLGMGAVELFLRWRALWALGTTP